MTSQITQLPTLWIGTQYYRAPTPTRSEWDEDLAAIKKAGFNGVQLRFQWRWMEPTRENYRFDDHDEIFDLCEKHGLDVIPQFFVETAPDYIFQDLRYGTRINFHGTPILPESNGSFYVGGHSPDFNNPGVIQRAEKFVSKCVEHYIDRKSLLAWHLWNEPRSRPRDDHAGPHGTAMFAQWLQDKYKTIEKFNEIWGRSAASFATCLPTPSDCDHAGWFLWRKFCSERVNSHVSAIREAVRKVDETRPCLLHTGCNELIQDPLTDISRDTLLCEHAERYGTSLVHCAGDMISFDNLEDHATFATKQTRENLYLLSMQTDWMRTVSSPEKFWVNEIYANAWHGSSPDMDPRDLRWSMIDGIARGADGIMFWTYKDERLQNELCCSGLVRLDGKPTDRLNIVKKTCADLELVKPYLADYKPAVAKIAIHHDADSDLISSMADRKTSGTSNTIKYRYKQTIKALHKYLWAGGVKADFTTEYKTPDAKKTPVWIIPDLRIVTKKMENAMNEYVSNGGSIIAGPALAERSKNLWVQSVVPGRNLKDLFGAERAIYPKTAPAIFNCGKSTGASTASLIAHDATVLLEATRNNDQFPVATMKKHGKGKAILLGFTPCFDENAAGTLAMIKEAGIEDITKKDTYVIKGETQTSPDNTRGHLEFHFAHSETNSALPENCKILVAPEGNTLSNAGDIAIVFIEE